MYVITLLGNTWGPWALVACAAVALVGAVVIYAIGAPRLSDRPRGFRAFVGFERLWVRPFMVFAYAFGALGCLALAVAAIAALVFTFDPAQLVVPIVAVVVGTAAAELLWRIACELVLLFVRLCEDVHAWRTLANESAASAVSVTHNEQPVANGAPSQPVEPAASPSQGEVEASSWAPVPGAGLEVTPLVGASMRPAASSFVEGAAPVIAAESPVLSVAPESAVFVAPMSESTSDNDENSQLHEDPFALPVEELPTVFDAATYEAYAARGAFDALPANDCGPRMVPAPESLGEWETVPVEANAPVSVSEPSLGGYGYPAWNCVCGAVGNTGAYCGQCGRPRPC